MVIRNENVAVSPATLAESLKTTHEIVSRMQEEVKAFRRLPLKTRARYIEDISLLACAMYSSAYTNALPINLDPDIHCVG